MKNELQDLFQLAAKFFLKKYKEQGGVQSTLAKELGITQSYLSSVTNGSRTASLELYSQIAAKLYGPLDKFLAVGRRLKEGRDPLEKKERSPEDSVENLIARLTYYVVDHKRIEKELADLKQFYETIVEKQQTGILVMDKDHQVIFANEQMNIMAEVPAQVIVGSTPFTAEKQIPGLDIKNFTSKYKEAFEHGQSLIYKNIRTKMPNGDTLFISGSFNPLIKEGKFDGMICSIYDTTTSHILRNLLIETLNSSAHGIGIVQQTNPGEYPKIYYMNKKFKKIFGLKEFDASEMPFSEAHKLVADNIKNSGEWLKFINRSISTNKTDQRYTITLKNNKQYEWISNPLIDNAGNHWGRLATVKEIPKKTGTKKT